MTIKTVAEVVAPLGAQILKVKELAATNENKEAVANALFLLYAEIETVIEAQRTALIEAGVQKLREIQDKSESAYTQARLEDAITALQELNKESN